MLASYTFNSQYRPLQEQDRLWPSLRLLEGGKFSPHQFAPTLIREQEEIRLHFYKWGLVPHWSETYQGCKSRLFLSHEQMLSHPAYQVPLKKRRCLIPADGFYVEKRHARGKRTYKAMMTEGETFCFAGIYDAWRQADGSLQYTFAILTAPTPLHRQGFGLQSPMIVPRQWEQAWLNPRTPIQNIEALLRTPVQDQMIWHPVEELSLTDTHAGVIEHVAA